MLSDMNSRVVWGYGGRMSAVKASKKKWQKNKWREDEGKEARDGAAMRKPVNGQATERKAREADTDER